MSEISKTERTTLKRAHERGVFERDTVNAIIDAAMICHVGYAVDGAPYVTPTIHWRDGDRVYWHGSSASRMMKQLRDGAQACLTVTHLDGLVMARSGFHHSANYRSAMVFGTATLVEGDAAKTASLKVFMEHLMPGRWDDVRAITAQELKATMILSMPIDEASAKVRDGGPIDDEEDYDLSCWAGVLPVTTVIGAPQDDARLTPGITPPDYLKRISIG